MGGYPPIDSPPTDKYFPYASANYLFVTSQGSYDQRTPALEQLSLCHVKNEKNPDCGCYFDSYGVADATCGRCAKAVFPQQHGPYWSC